MSGSLVGGVDSSIPLQAGKNGQEAANPLSAIGPAAQLIGTLNQVRLMPGQLQLQQQAIQSGQANLLNQQKRLAYSSLAPLLDPSQGPINLNKVTNVLAKAENSGIVTGPALDDLSSVSLTGDPTKDDAAIRAHILPNLQAPENAAAAVSMRPAGQLDTGPAIQPMQTGAPGTPTAGQVLPAGGSYRKGFAPGYGSNGAYGDIPLLDGQQAGPGIKQEFGPTTVGTGAGTKFVAGAQSGQFVPNAPGPSELNEMKQVWDPTTNQFKYVRNANVAPMVNGAGQPVNTATSPVPGLPNSGRVNAPGGGAQTPYGSTAASVPLGTPDEIGASVQHLAGARDKANNYQQTIQPVEAALNNLKGADTGRGSSVLNSLHAYVQDLTPDALKGLVPSFLYGDPDERAHFEEATKYLSAMSAAAPGGSRSNAGLENAQAANPNTHISNQAAQQVIQAVLGQRRMEQAGTLSFNNSGLPAARYDRYMNQWNTQQDPRGYMADQMSGPDKSKFVKALGGTTSDAYKKFKNSYQAGLQTGVLSPPNATAPQ